MRLLFDKLRLLSVVRLKNKFKSNKVNKLESKIKVSSLNRFLKDLLLILCMLLFDKSSAMTLSQQSPKVSSVRAPKLLKLKFNRMAFLGIFNGNVVKFCLEQSMLSKDKLLHNERSKKK